ncbi:hypothetical protein ABI59_17980 [Acidobacteria bacterium Mor1]|nr:hypothetical protein ABI59_17980 [Acidobacteria bacterium Mor1]
MRIEPAGPESRDDILNLLAAAELPAAGAEQHLAHFFVARDGDRLVGSIGLEVYQDVGLLRSLAVVPELRGSGLGRKLVQRLVEHARDLGIVRIYLLTTTAETFFPRFGFQPIPRDAADPRLGESEEFRGACPQDAACLRLEL